MRRGPRKTSETQPSHRASQELYRALFDQDADGVLLTNAQGRIVEINRRGCEMLGYTPEEPLGRAVNDLVAPDHPAQNRDLLEELRSTKGLLGEYRLRGRDGSSFPAEVSAWALPSGGFLGLVRDVSGRRQAERESDAAGELLWAREELRRVMASVSDYLWSAEVDEEGNWKYNYYSPVVEKITGRPPEFFLASPQRWLATVHPDDQPRILEAFRRLVDRKSDREQDEYRVVRPDGSIRWVRDSATVTPLESGRLRVDGVVSDISEHKRAAEQHRTHVWLLQSLDRISRAMQGTNDLEETAGEVLDAVLAIFDCDRAWLCYPFERRPSWLSLIERTRPEYPGGLSLGVGESMDPDAVAVFESVRGADGVVVSGPEGDLRLPAEVTERYGMQSQIAMAIYPRIGEPWIFGLHQCSHPRVWTPVEKRLFREIGPRLADALTSLLAHRSLRLSERKLEKAGHMALVGWWERDYEADVFRLSREAEAILGLSPGEQAYTMEQWQELWRTLIHPQDHDRVIGALAQAVRGGPRYDVEYRVIRPDGRMRFVHAGADITRSESGRLQRVFGMIQDITERKELEAQNERLAAQFHQAQKMESIGRLAGGIAHDFNNLLVPIIGYIDLNLERRLTDDSEVRADLVQVRKAAQRAAALTRQILAFSRQQVLKLQVLNLNQAIDNFKGMLQRLIGEDIELQAFLDPSLGLVEADGVQVEQVLLNLAINSRDAMPGGGRLTIETENTYLDEAYVEKHADGLSAGNYVMLAVSDTGEGMDTATRERIFDPFFTTKESGKGTGLGLATVFGIVKQHRGHIGVYSEPGHGTTFKIYLPRAKGAVQITTPEIKEPVSLHGTETVLVVEDEEMVRQLVCETLAAHGYDVIEVERPTEFLGPASERDTIDLLLTDVIMPGMNGKEIYQQLSAVHPECKVLYMSGYTRNVIVHHGILKEGISFLQKPFTIRDLALKVREILDG